MGAGSGAEACSSIPHSAFAIPQFLRYGRVLLAPVLIWILVAVALRGPLRNWLDPETSYDKAVLREWIENAGRDKTLSAMVDEYLELTRRYAELNEQAQQASASGEPGPTLGDLLAAGGSVGGKRIEIFQHLKALGEPPTLMYQGQLPLFAIIYRLRVRFDFSGLPAARRGPYGANAPRMDAPITWDSGQPAGQYEEENDIEVHNAPGERAVVDIRYQLHAYAKRQEIETAQRRRVRTLVPLAVAATGLGLAWLVLLQNREREKERAALLARQQIDQAERQLLQERADHAETERQLLQRGLALETAERQALELKSHLWASIGVMAGSYAHNIKNLLVRPNDLLRRCLEREGGGEQERMLREVQETLGTVTERLQQILATVRRDPGQSEHRPIDLGALLRGLGRTWGELAADRWKLDLVVEVDEEGGPPLVAGDLSHLQQAVENLLFNARDATFEMRKHVRDTAHRTGTGPGTGDGAEWRRAVLAAAGWRGRVVLRSRRAGDEALLEVSDNGVGMTEEVRRRCTETHFTTKRGNALYEGLSTGMGLGLSFVLAILEHHRARLEIESEVLHGSTFRARFPLLKTTA
jgi:signal transduction histidine kinase